MTRTTNFGMTSPLSPSCARREPLTQVWGSLEALSKGFVEGDHHAAEALRMKGNRRTEIPSLMSA